MDRIFSPYNVWEDYQAGMYSPCKEDRLARVQKAVETLGNAKACRKSMKRVVKEWRYATDYNLSFKGQNRKAWLGQAACCIAHGVREDETRQAWGILTKKQRNKANAIAQEIIDDWYESRDGQLSFLETWGNNEKTVGN